MTLYKKQRLKVPSQTFNKVYLNKNSKFRLFYNKRAKKFKNRRGFYRIFIILRNMKWTIARRYIGNRIRLINRLRFRYSNELKNKQQIKQFYGNLHNKQLLKFLRLGWQTQLQFRYSLCLKNLESRIDILLLRMRILPTIFACNRFILHRGIYINNEKIFLPHYILKYSDVISFSKSIWFLLYIRLVKKLINRYKGAYIYKKRKLYYLNKKHKKNKRMMYYLKRKQLIFLKYINYSVIKYLKLQKKVIYIINKLLKNDNNIFVKEFCLKLIIIFYKLIRNLILLTKLKNILRKWISKLFYKGTLLIILLYIHTQFICQRLDNNLNFFYYLYKIIIKKQILTEKEKKKMKMILKENKKNKNFLKLFFQNIIQSIFQLTINKKNILKKFLEYRQKNMKRSRKVTWNTQIHWYIPQNLEIDYITLRLSLINNPQVHNILYPFYYSLYKLICFYTDYGYR